MFNKGYKCSRCGPMETATKRTRKGETVFICPNCGQVVTEWERPLNERIGRCGTCGQASFKLKMENDRLIRICNSCYEVFDTWTEKVIKRGRMDGEVISISHADE